MVGDVVGRGLSEADKAFLPPVGTFTVQIYFWYHVIDISMFWYPGTTPEKFPGAYRVSPQSSRAYTPGGIEVREMVLVRVRISSSAYMLMVLPLGMFSVLRLDPRSCSHSC